MYECEDEHILKCSLQRVALKLTTNSFYDDSDKNGIKLAEDSGGDVQLNIQFAEHTILMFQEYVC